MQQITSSSHGKDVDIEKEWIILKDKRRKPIAANLAKMSMFTTRTYSTTSLTGCQTNMLTLKKVIDG